MLISLLCVLDLDVCGMIFFFSSPVLTATLLMNIFVDKD